MIDIIKGLLYNLEIYKNHLASITKDDEKIIGFEKIYRLKSDDLRVKMIALYGGFLGIIIASLANPIFGQAPMAAIMYICMVYLTIADKLDLEFVADEKKEVEDNNLKIAA